MKQSLFNFFVAPLLFIHFGFSAVAENIPQYKNWDNAVPVVSTVGRKLTFYHPESSSNFRQALDEILEDILGTKIGLSICRAILKSDSKLIETHIGVSRATANRIAINCFNHFHSPPHSFVTNGDPNNIQKLTLLPGFDKHLYSLVISSMNGWPFDSWTEPFSNRTILVISNESDFNRLFITQLLAHEIAVYFDSKSWPGSSQWKSSPAFANVEMIGDEPTRIATALLNPFISAELSAMRAFRVEKEIVEEIAQKRKWKIPKEYQYDPWSPYFSTYCRLVCIQKHFDQEFEKLMPYALPLLVFSPNYTSMIRSEIENQLTREDGAPLRKPNILRILDLNFKLYLDENYSGQPFINMVEPLLSPNLNKSTEEVSQVFANFLLPADMAILKSANIRDDWRYMSATEYFTVPLLSSDNIRMSRGPRPRIRIGGTR